MKVVKIVSLSIAVLSLCVVAMGGRSTVSDSEAAQMIGGGPCGACDLPTNCPLGAVAGPTSICDQQYFMNNVPVCVMKLLGGDRSSGCTAGGQYDRCSWEWLWWCDYNAGAAQCGFFQRLECPGSMYGNQGYCVYGTPNIDTTTYDCKHDCANGWQ